MNLAQSIQLTIILIIGGGGAVYFGNIAYDATMYAVDMHLYGLTPPDFAQ